jgi:hypothetical protein
MIEDPNESGVYEPVKERSKTCDWRMTLIVALAVAFVILFGLRRMICG